MSDTDKNAAPYARIALTRRLLKHALRHWPAFAGMIVCMVVVGATTPLLPLILAPLLDAGGDKEYLLPPDMLPYAFLLLAFTQALFSYGRSYLGGWLSETLKRDLRGLMTARLLRLPAARLQKETLGFVTSRFMTFVPAATSAIMPVCLALVQETIKAAGLVGVMLYWNWRLALVVLAASPVIALMIFYMRKRMQKTARAAQRATAVGQSRLNETIRLTPLIKMHGETKTRRWMGNTFSMLRGTALRVNILLAAGQPATQILLAVPFAFVIAHVAGALTDGRMTPGTVVAFTTAMILLPTPIRILARSVNVWEQMLVAAKEVFSFLDAPAEADNGARNIARAQGEIVFDNVSFGYNEETKVLDGLSLNIAAGETVALVGRTGAGKSTIINLLPRFYSPNAGVIRMDGGDIRELTLESLRRQFTMVPQTPMLFNDSVAMNVAYPDDAGKSRERVMKALEQANAAEFVRQMPDGVNTVVGEEGKLLSGGQRQRLSLARAFYRDSPVVILDEATSALDSETEAAIKDALRRLLAQRTAVIVSHRFFTIDLADRIAVLDDGKIIAAGDIPTLRKTCPLFAAMYDAQMLEE